jgi:protease YdgD
VLAIRPEVLVLSCSVDFGSSGAPVFALDEGSPRVISVVSAKAEVEGRKVSLAVPMQEPLAELRAMLENDAGEVGKRVTGVRTLSAGEGRFPKP